MSPTDQFQAFANKVYMLIKNRRYDDFTSDDGQTFLEMMVDWANMFIDELELELNPDGTPIDWIWVQQLAQTLGTATTGAASVAFDTKNYNNLIAGENRYVQILQDSTPVANFAVVAPGDISNISDRVTEDMCTLVGGNIVFSRPFRDTENNGTIVGDVTGYIPRFTYSTANGKFVATNIKALSVIKPQTLLTLGVAKNESLPDIVQGKLSPSYVQKFNDMLANAIARSNASSRSGTVQRDNFSFISGVGF